MTAILPLDAGANVGGHYRIEGLINAGGFGVVYRGLALSEGNRPCAIKETYDVTPVARRQALMEAAILFTIKSDHLPQIYDAFEERGRFYLVMQLIEGQNCSQLLKAHGGPFDEQQVLNWLLPVADVLQELHGRNPPVLHRDIKPANIILTPQGRAVLVDFGLTRLYDPGVATQTLTRAVSEGFSPLEQYVGQTSPRSDIYALAATMYFLLTAQAPPTSVVRSVGDNLLPPRHFNQRVTPRVEQVLLKALAVNAEDRYTSMQEFARALRAPAFTGYADPTISQSSSQAASSQTERALVPAPPSPPVPAGRSSPQQPAALQPVPKRSARPAQQQLILPGPRQRRASRPRRGAPAPTGAGWGTPYPLTPIGHAGQPIPPPAGGSSPAQFSPVPVSRELSNPFNQGCLWGLLQGLLSGLLVLFLHRQEAIYLAIGQGFLFYLLAGFFTTCRGGPVLRAARAGIWAGVISTIVFWIVLPVGLVVQALQLIDRTQRLGEMISFNMALGVVRPPFLASQSVASVHQNWNHLLVFLVIGLICALSFALVGGMLGHRKKGHRRSIA